MDNREILMTHFTKPENFGFLDDEKLTKIRLKSPACSDELWVQIKVEGDKIIDIRFEGSACVIATSSSDILFTMLKGKTFSEAKELIDRYHEMIQEGKQPENLGDLSIFENVHRQKGRWKCATLSSDGILEFIEKQNH